MLLWILSDLHVELTRGWDLPPPEARPDFDVLVVAGDLIPRMERGVSWLLERVPDKPVIYVPGNHEAYGCDERRTVEKAMEAAEGTVAASSAAEVKVVSASTLPDGGHNSTRREHRISSAPLIH